MKTTLRTLLAISPGLFLFIFLPITSEAVTATWNNSTGNWTDASKWDTASFPNGSGFDAVVGGGTVTLDQAITIQTYTQSGSTLTSTGGFKLTLNGLFTWDSSAHLSGNIMVQANAGMTISGSNFRILGGTTSGAATLTNVGTAAFTGTGAIYIPGGSPGSVFNNNGTFNASSSGGIAGAVSGSAKGTFNNVGTFNKSGSNTTTTISAIFNKSGPVNVNSGTLLISSNGTDAGSYSVASSGKLTFSGNPGNRTLGSGVSVSGAGEVAFGGIGSNTTTINGATYNLTGTTTITGNVDFLTSASTGQLEVGGSGLRGGAGGLVASGLFTWTGGTLGDNGTTTANGGIALSGGGVKTLGDGSGAKLVSSGTTTHSAGDLRIQNNGSVFTNNGTYNMTSSGTDILSGTGGGAAGRFVNHNVFTKGNSGGTVQIGVAFDNEGTVTVNIGKLELNNGGDHSGSFVVNGASQLDFGGGIHDLDLTTSITAGNSATVFFSGGESTLNRAYSITGTTNISGGTVHFEEDSSTRVLTLSAGQRGGDGDLTVTNAFTWTGGALGTNGDNHTTTVNGGITISGGSPKSLGGGGPGTVKLVNNSSANLSGGNLQLNSSSSGTLLTNNGTFNATDDANILGSGSGSSGGKFANSSAGTFNKTGAGTTTTIGAIFTNAGAVHVSEGTLAFTNIYTQSGGLLLLNGGAVSTSGVLDIQNGSLMGAGTVTGAVANNGALVPGLSAGQLEITGDLTLGSASQLAIELGGTAPGVSYDVISEAGSAALNLNGMLVLTFLNAFQNSIANSDLFTIVTSNAPITGAFSNVASGARLGTTDGFGSFLVTYAGMNSVILSDFQPGFILTQAGSRKTHGSAGTFEIDLPLTGAPGVECRSSGGNHTLVFAFSNDVVNGSASVTAGTGTVSGSPTFSGSSMTVDLTGVTDAQEMKIQLSGVTNASAQTLPDAVVTVRFLIGDTTGNSIVNSSDISQIKGQSGVPVTAQNARQDVTPTGTINSSDIGQVKANSGANIPPAPEPKAKNAPRPQR